tara:strand:- start:182 stop:412 length:231 start_codon:yes stop_codon:yes gene_type:complete
MVISIFQRGELQRPILNLDHILIGLVLLRLTFCVQGLKIGLFPICKNIAAALTQKGSLLKFFVQLKVLTGEIKDQA